MKQIKIFGLLLFAMFAFNACGDDDDEDVAIDITGTKWETTYIKFEITGTNSYKEDELIGDLSSSEYYHTLIFNSDGTFKTEMTGDYVETGTWIQKNKIITVVVDNNSTTSTISGNCIDRSTTVTENGYTTKSIYKYEQIKE